MSGIEITGLLLGSLPLLISAIEHYNDGLAPAKAFWKWGDQLSHFTRELWYQHTSYELTVRVLLSPITTDAELDEMMSDPESKLWKSGRMGAQLHEKLGPAYKAYLYTIKEIEEILKSIANNLDIDRDANVTRNELEAIILANPPTSTSGQGVYKFQFKRRVRFVMKRGEVGRMLERLKACNDRLEGFTEKAEKLDEPCQAGWKSTFAIPLEQIQNYASSLHQVLARAWNCSAHTSHCANLMLEDRMVRPTKKKRNAPKDTVTCFKMLFMNHFTPTKWCNAEIRVLEDTRTKARPKVQIAVSPPSPPLAPAPDGNLSKFEVIEDICATIHQASPVGSCLGLCLDLQGKLRGVYPVDGQNLAFSGNIVTLEELLMGLPLGNGKLTDEDRYILAVTLASSFLQLHSTPWLTNQWSKKDIVFPQTGDGSRNAVNVRRPFITQTYAHGNYGPQGQSSTVCPTRDDGASLLSLGTLLLEVRFGQRIEDRQRSEDLGPDAKPNEATAIQTLKEWIAQEKGNLSWAFRDAVSHCMRCFADPNADLQNPDFRQSVMDNVVVPLMNELHHWQEGPPSR